MVIHFLANGNQLQMLASSLEHCYLKTIKTPYYFLPREVGTPSVFKYSYKMQREGGFSFKSVLLKSSI